LVKPPEVDGFVRTVIETVDPALEPVAKLRRFVIKRVQVVGAPLLEGGRSTQRGTSGRRPPRRKKPADRN
jgi:hypothetical protein